MGTSYFDSEGSATFLFGKVPIYAVKKATFKDKLGTLHTLLKMIYNSVTYDFTKTAQGGAVIFANNYQEWEFIAPDDRLDFEGYSSMTIGETLAHIRSVVSSNPIPAWEQFAQWVNSLSGTMTDIASACDTYLIAPYGANTTRINAPVFSQMGSFVDFLDMLIAACQPAKDNPMSLYKRDGAKFQCAIRFCRNDTELISMVFKFRE